ncbi:hypothetical protein Anas_12396 [Armadillidium nasatum]|uniref:Uncharacterized protein n=1 Tax=Armadillidium nasatum TaxID=96803 RepID=A0A5N5T9I0_9CRUS|nr:hypothetical protein Anas_12396 [Armadillidium nasatum]
MDGLNVWESIQGKIPSPRKEILVNIDPVYNGASIRVCDWKLLFSEYLRNPIDPSEVTPEFNGWFGPRERTNSSENFFQDTRLRFYNSTMIPPGNKPADPRSNPIFWNNTWTNWFDFLDETHTFLFRINV